jgi:hypothetical protein
LNDNNVCEGFDEFYAYDDKWDVNIHMNGEPQNDSCGCPPAVDLAKTAI